MAQSYSFKSYLYLLLNDFISILFPQICVGCNESLRQYETHICLECKIRLPQTHYENNPQNPVERLFWLKSDIQSATSGYFFSKKSRLQKMIHAFKYRGDKDIAVYLGKQLGTILLKSNRFNNIDLIIPVPLHPQKLKTRGYNQAEQLAIGISKSLNIPVDTHSLVRLQHNETQTNKGVFNRYTNVKTIFNVPVANNIKKKHILLVDDVITSGSTIEACANQLLQTQGVQISIVSLAIASG